MRQANRSGETAAPRAFAAMAIALAVAVALLVLRPSGISQAFAIIPRGRRLVPLVTAAIFLLVVVRIFVAHRRFGRSALDRALAAAAVLCSLTIAGTELASTVRAAPTGDAVAILSAASIFCLATLAVALSAGVVAGESAFASGASRWAARLGSCGLVLSGALLVVEAWVVPAALQDWYEIEALDGSGTTLHEPDPDLFWRMRPHYRGRLVHPEMGGLLIETNSLGLRDREPGAKDEENREAIGGAALVLGDSFAFGLGLETDETLSARLEDLSVAPRVVNAGVSGFGTFDAALFVDRVASAYPAPAFVIAQVYAGNDFEENLGFLRRHSREHDPAWISERFPGGESLFARAAALEESGRRLTVGSPSHSWFRRWIDRRWRLGRLLVDRWERLAASRGETPRGAPTNSMLVRSLEREPDAEVQLAFEATDFALRAVAARARALGARFAVCIVPARVQMDRGLLENALRAARLDPSAFDLGRPQAVLSEACAGAGISFVDLSDEFRERMARGEKLYYAEGHWRPAGVAVAAEAIASALKSGDQPDTGR